MATALVSFKKTDTNYNENNGLFGRLYANVRLVKCKMSGTVKKANKNIGQHLPKDTSKT